MHRSSKEIHYDEQTKRFDIYNEIDDTYQSNLTEKSLHTKTNIPEAIKNGVFYYNRGTIVGDIRNNKPLCKHGGSTPPKTHHP
jgi:hypothetical protein